MLKLKRFLSSLFVDVDKYESDNGTPNDDNTIIQTSDTKPISVSDMEDFGKTLEEEFEEINIMKKED